MNYSLNFHLPFQTLPMKVLSNQFILSFFSPILFFLILFLNFTNCISFALSTFHWICHCEDYQWIISDKLNLFSWNPSLPRFSGELFPVVSNLLFGIFLLFCFLWEYSVVNICSFKYMYMHSCTFFPPLKLRLLSILKESNQYNSDC